MSRPTHLDPAAIELGTTFPPVVHEVTQDVIDVAALAHLDFNPVHTDVPWAARAQVFGTPKTVAHGMFTMSQMASVVQRHWFDANATVVGIEAKLTRPVPVGDTVTAVGEVIEVHPREPGQDLVMVRVTSTNQDDEIVGVGTVTVRIDA